MVLAFAQVFQRTKITMIRTYTPDLVFFVERKKNLNTGNTTYKHEVIILNRSNKSAFLYLKIY